MESCVNNIRNDTALLPHRPAVIKEYVTRMMTTITSHPELAIMITSCIKMTYIIFTKS